MSSTHRVLVIVNPAAARGTALAKWAKLCELDARWDARTALLDLEGSWRSLLQREIRDGTRLFVAAGGDGTVGAVANALVELRGSVALERLVLGAIGLGSSNDFHKPLRSAMRGIPVRLDRAHATRRDVARVRYLDDAGKISERLFLVSASFGITARANAFFNSGDVLLRALKPRWVGAAIAYAAVRTLMRHRALVAELTAGDERVSSPLANLSVMKTPHLSGTFRYDTPVEADSGLFAVNLCEAESRSALLRTLLGLARGRFVGREGTRHWTLPSLEVELDGETELELDGETVRARRAWFDILPERMTVCA